MNSTMKSLALFSILTLTVCGCSGKFTPLPEGNWAPETHAKLTQIMQDYGRCSKDYNRKEKPYVVFDFDNTSIINDVELSLFQYQLSFLRFKIAPDCIFDIITNCIPDMDFPMDGGLTIRKLATDITKDYEYLYDNFIGKYTDPKSPEALTALEEIRKTDEYRDFTAKMVKIDNLIYNYYDYGVGLVWILTPLTCMSYDEIRELTGESCRYYNAMEGMSEVLWESPDMGVCGKVSATSQQGMHTTDEMKNLYSVLRKNGFDIYICSASLELIVETMACDPQYGFNMDEDHVIALRTAESLDGNFLAVMDPKEIATYMEGKTEAIKTLIAPKHGGKSPVLVAGDSNGDYNMLTDFDDLKLGLIINCGNKGNIARLIESGRENIAVQERDEATASFVPTK